MVQVKKTKVRDAILRSASELFTERGYSNTTLANIAKNGGVTMSNIYNYFDSKLEVLFAVYEPWFDARLDQLAKETAIISEPKAKLRFLLLSLFRDIPAEDNCFANNFIQAIATRKAGERYSRDLLLRSEKKISEILHDSLPKTVRSVAIDDLLSHLLLMAYDGFVINYHLSGPSRRLESIVDLLCDLAMDES